MISQKQIFELIAYYEQFDVNDPPTRCDGTDRHWINKYGDWHRENDRPAYINKVGFLSWSINHFWHRETGPARIGVDNVCEYRINDKRINSKDWFKRIMELE